MTTTHDIADAIGRKRLAAELNVGLTAVGNAVVRGEFPASWFLIVKSLCDEAGANCPPHLFNMRGYNTQNVDGLPLGQSGEKASPEISHAHHE